MAHCSCCGAGLGEAAGDLCPACLLESALDVEDAAPGADPLSAVAADSFGPYTPVGILGQGGMGVVFLAEQTGALNRRVALKVLKSDLDTRAVSLRFDRERKTLARLEHPNIVTIFDAGMSAALRPYFVMEVVDGKPITEYCDARRLRVAERLGLFLQLCSAVEYAHGQGVVHRDLKPSNVLVVDSGEGARVKVIDFGIAKLASPEAGYTAATVEGQFAGTPGYMSPEQAGATGEAIGPSSDVYSLGAMLYEILGGRRIFDFSGASESNPLSVLRKILDEEPLPVSRSAGAEAADLRSASASELQRQLHGDLDAIVEKALGRRPAERYGSAAEFTADLERHRAGRPIAARRHSVARRIGKWLTRHRAAAGATVAIGTLALAFVWERTRSPFVAPPADLTVEPLTTFPGDEYSGSFSPQGDRVVFSWDGDGRDNQNLYVMKLSDRTHRRLTAHPAADGFPVWSPDGRTIAFTRRDAVGPNPIYLVPVEGGPERVIGGLTDFANAFDWSPDSRWLVTQEASAGGRRWPGLNLVAAGSGEVRPLAAPLSGKRYTSPAFSPDGRRIVFIREGDGVAELALLDLTAEMRAGGPVRIVRLAGFRAEVCLHPRFTVDGKAILFSYNRGGARRLWRVPVPRSQEETVVPVALPVGEGVAFPELSRTGNRLLFTRHLSDPNLWRMPLSGSHRGGDLRKLISSTRAEAYPDLSADGRVVFESGRTGYNEIWISNQDGGEARAVTNFRGPVTGSPRWSPDGDAVAFDTSAAGQPEIYVVTGLKSGRPSAPRRLTDDPAPDVMPAWSPDGRWIYFTSTRAGQQRIWRMPAAGGEPAVISPGAGRGAVVSFDGRWVYFSRDGAIWRCPADGGPEERVVGDTLPRSFLSRPGGLWFLRWPGPLRFTLHLLDANGREHAVAELNGRVQAGLAVAFDESSAIIARDDEGARDLMLVEGFR